MRNQSAVQNQEMRTTAVDNLSVDAALLKRYRNSLPSFVKPMFAEPISVDHGDGSELR